MTTKLARLIKDIPLVERGRLERYRAGELFLVSTSVYHPDLVDAKSIANGERYTLNRGFFEVVDDGAQLQG